MNLKIGGIYKIKYACHYFVIVDNIDLLYMYELSKEYSYLYNYPENIKEDWMKILEETKEYLKEDGIEV